MAAESAYSGCCYILPIENLNEAVFARGMILEMEFLELQVNSMTRWDGNVPSAQHVIKIISRK